MSKMLNMRRTLKVKWRREGRVQIRKQVLYRCDAGKVSPPQDNIVQLIPTQEAKLSKVKH